MTTSTRRFRLSAPVKVLISLLVGAVVGLQRLQPGVDIFGRKFRFQTFDTTGPGIHRK